MSEKDDAQIEARWSGLILCRCGQIVMPMEVGASCDVDLMVGCNAVRLWDAHRCNRARQQEERLSPDVPKIHRMCYWPGESENERRARGFGQIVLVVYCPERGADDKPPLFGQSMSRLCSAAGIVPSELECMCDRASLLPVWPGHARSSTLVPHAHARASALLLWRELAGRDIVLVGRAAARAFYTTEDPPFFQWIELGAPEHPKRRVAVIPYPTGHNRLSLDKDTARRFFQSHLQPLRR